MRTNIPPLDPFDNLPPEQQAQAQLVTERVKVVLSFCVEDGIHPILIANVLVSCASRIIACAAPEARAEIVREIKQNMPTAIEFYAERIAKEKQRNGR